jgi:neutral trehalase
MDNSPAWDEALARITLTPDQIPAYQRVDVRLADPEERPADSDYDRYAYLVSLFRDRDYDTERIREDCPFVIQPILFNSILVQSDRDLARIARVVGSNPAPFDEWADRTGAGLEKLWDAEQRIYFDYDVRAGARVATWSAAGFAPLYAHVPSVERAERMIEGLKEVRAPLSDDLWAVPSLSPTHPQFRPGLYWRGPVWPLIQWIVQQGVERYGHTELARQIAATTLELSRRDGFWEHYSPMTGRGQGDREFSWTAGLVLDVLAGTPEHG